MMDVSLLKEMKKLSDEPPVIETNISLASSFIPKKEKKKKKEEKFKDPESWFENASAINDVKDIKVRKKSKFNIFGDDDDDEYYGKKKKKKKKNKNGVELTDFRKEFATETALINNLLRDNAAFISQMQRDYDHMTSTKSTHRGISKTTTDLASAITSARSTSMNLIKEKINIKKLIQEMTYKERKELGINEAELNEDIINNAALTLKGIMADRGSYIDNNSDGFDIVDIDDESADLLASIISGSADQSSSDNDKILEYEKENVQLKVLADRDDLEEYSIIAVGKNGDIIPDYPVPEGDIGMKLNHSVMVATDKYGRKYTMTYSI